MNPHEKYRQQMLTTMTQGDMLLKLYDEIAKQIDLARLAIAQGRVEEMDAAISKAQRIVYYLRNNLDAKYDISAQLKKMYDFFGGQLVMASVKKDVQFLDDIKPLVQELRETFGECVKLDRISRTGMSSGAAVVR